MSSSVVEATADASPHLRVSASKKSQAPQTTSDKTEPSTRIDPPEASAVDDHFFWTYTEEPHRSRRQAIIKAHPEVCTYSPVAFSTKDSFTDMTSFVLPSGYQALRTRAPDQICRSGRRLPSDPLRLPAPQHVHVRLEISRDCIRDRSHLEPEPLPRHPRDLP